MTNDLAIRILKGDVLGTTDQTHEAVAMAIKALSTPVREVRRGKWILNKAVANIDTYYYSCSKCGNERCFIDAYKANWCEECGADMREDEE